MNGKCIPNHYNGNHLDVHLLLWASESTDWNVHDHLFQNCDGNLMMIWLLKMMMMMVGECKSHTGMDDLLLLMLLHVHELQWQNFHFGTTETVDCWIKRLIINNPNVNSQLTGRGDSHSHSLLLLQEKRNAITKYNRSDKQKALEKCQNRFCAT